MGRRSVSGYVQPVSPLPPQVPLIYVANPRPNPEQQESPKFKTTPASQEDARLTSPTVKAEDPILSASLDTVPPFFKALGAVAGVAALLNFLWKWWEYQDQTLERASDRILKKFEMSAGFELYTSDFDSTKIPREALEADLEKFLCDAEFNTFGFILAVSGCGKSTAVRRVLQNSKMTGAVYFEFPSIPTGAAVAAFANLLDFYGFPLNGGATATNLASNDLEWSKLYPSLQLASLKYKNKNKKPAVLVLDNSNKLAKNNLPLLESLMEFAKGCADGRVLRVVFLGNDSSTLPIFNKFSAFNRAEAFISKNLDLPDSEAAEFLVKKRNFEPTLAQDLVEKVAGGRFAILNAVSKTSSVQRTLAAYWGTTSSRLKKLGLTPNDPFFKQLCEEKEVGRWIAEASFSDEAVQAMLECNILAVDGSSYLSFHSRHIETYFHQFHNGKAEIAPEPPSQHI